MNNPLPLNPPDVEADAHLDIDTRILRVEQRLMAREARLRHGAAGLARQARRQLRPARLVAPAGGVLLAALALRSLFRRHAPDKPSSRKTDVDRLPWMRALTLAWPLLPQPWRDRVSPGAAGGLLSLALPLLRRLLRRRAASALDGVAAVDLQRLSGRWFLVGELLAPWQAEPLQPGEMGLLPAADGRLELLQRRIDRHGTHGQQAWIEPVAGSGGATLRLSPELAALQPLPEAWSELRVLHVSEAYDEALIGSTERDTLWLMSRAPALAAERRAALVTLARERGFEVGRLYVHGA